MHTDFPPETIINMLLAEIAAIRAESSHAVAVAKAAETEEKRLKERADSIARAAGIKSYAAHGVTLRIVESAIKASYDTAAVDGVVALLLRLGYTDIAEQLSAARTETVRAGYATVSVAKER